MWGQSWQANGSSLTTTASVGIGTTNPVATLTSAPSSSNPGSGIRSFGLVTSGSYWGGIGLQDGSGNIGIWDDAYGANLHFGFGTNLGGLNPKLTFTSGGNLGIGTTNPQRMLHVAGTIGAEEVIVSSKGADYVFKPEYALQPLSEVKQYIQANHHLPDVPSEAALKEKGVSLGEIFVFAGGHLMPAWLTGVTGSVHNYQLPVPKTANVRLNRRDYGHQRCERKATGTGRRATVF